LRRISVTTSIESTLRSTFQGFAFDTNRWIFLFILTSASVFAATDILSLRITSGAVLAITSGFAVVPLAEFVTSFPRQLREIMTLRGAKRTYSFGLTAELLNLAKRMGVCLKEEDILEVAPEWINAGATIDGRIILGQTIADEFDKEARKGILAHELAHLRAKHPTKRAIVLFLMSIPVLLFITFLHLPNLVNLLLLFSAYGLIVPMVSWRFEYDADAIATTFVGIEPVIKGLRKIAEVKHADVRRDTYSHPSISNRISRLQKIDR
jgi:Zn-dependent protease with chaperone function